MEMERLSSSVFTSVVPPVAAALILSSTCRLVPSCKVFIKSISVRSIGQTSALIASSLPSSQTATPKAATAGWYEAFAFLSSIASTRWLRKSIKAAVVNRLLAKLGSDSEPSR